MINTENKTAGDLSMEDHISFRAMTEADWPAVAEIYRQGIQTGVATFEQQVPEWNSWDESHMKSCRIIAEVDGEIVGWAALTPVSGRCVYAGVAEVSVYVSANYRGHKTGRKLLQRLIEESEKEGLWTLQAGIFPENTGSIRIHEALGFRKIGYREKIGKLNGTWHDTVLYERRSKKVGAE